MVGRGIDRLVSYVRGRLVVGEACYVNESLAAVGLGRNYINRYCSGVFEVVREGYRYRILGLVGECGNSAPPKVDVESVNQVDMLPLFVSKPLTIDETSRVSMGGGKYCYYRGYGELLTKRQWLKGGANFEGGGGALGSHVDYSVFKRLNLLMVGWCFASRAYVRRRNIIFSIREYSLKSNYLSLRLLIPFQGIVELADFDNLAKKMNFMFPKMDVNFKPKNEMENESKKLKPLRMALKNPTMQSETASTLTSGGGSAAGSGPVAAAKLSMEDKLGLYIEKFNEICGGRQFRKTAGCRKKFSARLKEGFTGKEMLLVVKMALRDPFHAKTNFAYVTPEYCLRDNIMSRYLALASATAQRGYATEYEAYVEACKSYYGGDLRNNPKINLGISLTFQKEGLYFVRPEADIRQDALRVG